MVTYKEKRRQKRNNVNLPVTYVCSDESNVDPRDGVAFDLCQSGMSFYTNAPLREGLDLRIKTLMWESPKKCIIKWRSKKSRNIYKVGVSFR